MRYKTFLFSALILFSAMQAFPQIHSIRVNQVGYNSNSIKTAFVAGGKAQTFELRNASTNEVVYTGSLSEGKYWELSDETLQIADFSDFTNEGTYVVSCDGCGSSFPFTIQKEHIFQPVSKAAIRAFYYWRASTELLPEHATFNGVDFSRPLGHADDVVKIHHSAASKSRPEGTVVSAPKGWYDAGDYNLYVVNAGISFHSLAFAYELFPEYYKSLNLTIPETGNGIPDILNELKWELDWLFAMQDEDGGVYAKLSSLHFCSMIMPHEDNLERYMIGKSTASTLDFAAMMAMSARVFANYDKSVSDKALAAAKKAWNWATQHPSDYYTNPVGVTTGGYVDYNVKDEFFWAAAELFITTNDKTYFDALDFALDFPVPEWHSVTTLGLMSLVLHENEYPQFKSKIDEVFSKLTDDLVTKYENSGNRVPIVKYNWGSNGYISSCGALLGLAYKIYGDSKYKNAMLSSWNYLLGCNPTDYCFVSGFGSKYPRHFHDRRCTADGIEEPLPGYLAGGATNIVLRDCGGRTYPSQAPAACYLDKICSFSTNEIAINWNAPFALLAGMVENF